MARGCYHVVEVKNPRGKTRFELRDPYGYKVEESWNGRWVRATARLLNDGRQAPTIETRRERRKHILISLALLAILITAAILGGCATLAGAGEDLISIVNAIRRQPLTEISAEGAP